MEIRDATERDIPKILEIYNYYVLNSVATFDYVIHTKSEMISKWNGIVEKKDPFLVAMDGEILVGYGYISAYRAKIGYQYTREVTIYVDKNHINKGIANHIFRVLHEKSVERGYRQLVFMIEESNTHSIQFFTRNGARQIGIHPSIGFKFDKWLSVVILQMQIGPGDSTPPAKL